MSEISGAEAKEYAGLDEPGAGESVNDFSFTDCLACNPFEGDFGEPGDRTIRDKIVKARKGGECNLCGCGIVPGTMTRSCTDVFGGKIATYRWCTECCAAMAKSFTDDGEAWGARAALRRV